MRFSSTKATILSPAVLLVLAVSSLGAEQSVIGANRIATAQQEFQQGRFDAALAALEEADKGAEASGRSLDLRGCIYLEQQKFAEAVNAFTGAAESDPASLGQIHVGDAWARQRKWPEARAAYETALKGTNILMLNERLRFAILMTHLGEKNDPAAQKALERILFPTESAAYYYAQAVWAFAHEQKREGQQWLGRADDIFSSKSTAWFARFLFDFGWIKRKPEPVFE